MHLFRILVILAVMSTAVTSLGQQPCTRGVRVDGLVTDPSGAMVPGATIQASTGAVATSDQTGHYLLPCLSRSFTLQARADGFAPQTLTQTANSQQLHLDIQLSIASVESQVQVSADDNTVALDPGRGPGTVTLDERAVQQLADDPDDLLRQLQMLASQNGGDPSTARITVDGFQNATTLPPKGSIASIRVNPDLFSAEYRWPPYGGGLIEIKTKPGAAAIHGAAFFTGSNGSWNATTAFAPSSTPASKRRYGFELSGPILPGRGDFSAALEKRDIDEFKVVNAQVLASDFKISPFRQTVPTPQRLWVASLRSGWQLGQSDTLTGSFAANVNSLGNQGVSALVLPEAGYSTMATQYELRLANELTHGAGQLHQTRVGLSSRRSQNTPNATTPSLQVAGYFTSGGATSQATDSRRYTLELDHDAMFTKGRNTLKLGTQSLGIVIHNHTPDTFNGAFLFGGGSAPALDPQNATTGQTVTIDGMDQYRRTLLGLPGGNPTTYQQTSGNPEVNFTQWQNALYLEENFQVTQRLTLSGGFRYQFQTSPDSLANFEPRLGIGWSPDKKSTWVIHARAGIFSNFIDADTIADGFRLNGRRQQQVVVYSPGYSAPLNPNSASIAVSTRREFAPALSQTTTFTGYFTVEHTFAHHWLARSAFYWGADWNAIRMRNTNAPIVSTAIGAPADPIAALRAPRPYGGNENILRYESSGHLAGNLVSFSVEQQSYKRFNLRVYYRHANFKANGGDGIVTPQSSYSEQGESARADWLRLNGVSLIGSLILPRRVELATELDAHSGAAYTITTGTDANGDGIVNDRPSYASPGMSGSVYHTRYGLMTADTTNGNVPRNVGTMPPTVHLDMNLSRAFTLNPKDKEHARTITFNLRAANVLNHVNINGVGTVVSSPSLDKPYQAESARRLEAGARFSF
ncbi:TonB-dependent receptor [Terriglobus albidus]|uniref:TonB-dependent receptor n=1 Tax=Terriglobus albidus TaxID=1592106 RepID=A0A5B9EAA9_9BACT|nr:TonB-dependent receptor [Terriglobus albidus]QEE27056.1 TonB-dependent receptor [Terriglobus albidus]